MREGLRPARLARIAGLLYLGVAVFAFIAMYTRSSVIKLGDAATTADNIRASSTLFRLGFVSDLVQATFFLSTAMALYLLLKHVNREVAAAMVVFVAVSVAIICLNLVNQYVALSIATGREYPNALGPKGSDALTMLLVDINHSGALVAQIFFGLWLLPLGYLVFKSGYFPRLLGVLLVIGCFGYLVDTLTRFLAPSLGASLSPFVITPAAIGELAFVAWLLVKGVNVQGRDASVPALV